MATLLKDFSASQGVVPPWTGREYLASPANFQIISGGGSDPASPVSGESFERHTILSSDGTGPNTSTGQRSELAMSGTNPSPWAWLPDGTVIYIGFWQYLPTNLPIPGPGSSSTPTAQGGSTAGSGHSIAFQLHSNDTGSPKVALNIRNCMYSMTYDYSIPTSAANWKDWDGSVASPRPAVVLGRWVHWTFWVKIASDSSGFCEIRAKRLGLDSAYVTLFPKLAMATTSGGGAYLKQGYYRGFGNSGATKETKTGTVYLHASKVSYANSLTDATFSQAALDLVSPATSGGGGGGGGGTVSTTPRHVLVFWEENHTLAQMESGLPKLWNRARSAGGAWLSGYHGVGHPSLRNYVTSLKGDDPGWGDDNPPSSHPVSGKSVFDLAIDAGRTAGAFCETMDVNNRLTDTGNYAVKHNPWAYFSDAGPRANANAFDVPMGTTGSGNLLNRINNGTLPNVGYAVPNLQDDWHDGSASAADNWLDSWLALLTATTLYRTGDLLIVVVGDEDDGTAGNSVLTVLLHPALTGQQIGGTFDHKALCKLYADIAGVTAPGSAATAPSILTAAGLSVFDWGATGGGGGGGGGGTGSAPLSETALDTLDGSSFDSSFWGTLTGNPSVSGGGAHYQATTTNRTVTSRTPQKWNQAGSHFTWRWRMIGDIQTSSGAFELDRCRAQLWQDIAGGNFITIKAMKTDDGAGTTTDLWHIIFDTANGESHHTSFAYDSSLKDWRVSTDAAGTTHTVYASSDGGSTWVQKDQFTTSWAWSATVLAALEEGQRLRTGTATVSESVLELVGVEGAVVTPPSAAVAHFDPTANPMDSTPWVQGDLIVVHLTGDSPTGYPTNLADLPFTDASGQADPSLSGVASSTARGFLFYKPYEPGVDTGDWTFAMSEGENWVANTIRIPNADVFAADNGVALVYPANWTTGTSFAAVADSPNFDGGMVMLLLSSDTDAVAGHFTAPSGWSTAYATTDSQVGGVGAAAFWKSGLSANTHLSTTFGITAAGGAEVAGWYLFIRPRQATKSSEQAVYNPRPKDQGYKFWATPPKSAGSNFTAGVLRLRKFMIGPRDVAFSKLAASVVQLGGSGLAGFYLYAYRVVGSQIIQIAATGDMAALVKTGGSLQKVDASVTAVGGALLSYAGGDPDAFGYIAALLDTADGTTQLQLARENTNTGIVNGALAASDGYAAATYGSGLTHSTVPTTLNLTDLAASSTDWWLAGE